jgi:hypothetical protein
MDRQTSCQHNKEGKQKNKEIERNSTYILWRIVPPSCGAATRKVNNLKRQNIVFKHVMREPLLYKDMIIRSQVRGVCGANKILIAYMYSKAILSVMSTPHTAPVALNRHGIGQANFYTSQSMHEIYRLQAPLFLIYFKCVTWVKKEVSYFLVLSLFWNTKSIYWSVWAIRDRFCATAR